MFFGFLAELRRRKVPVGTHEAVALAGALKAGLHDSSLEGFAHVARALLVHSETHLDAFDQAFAAHFRGVPDVALELTRELLDWLEEAKTSARALSDEERAMIEQLSPEELEQQFRERLAEQKERHDGGNRWIGTGGTSPFGHSGRAARPGIRVGGPGGMRSAIRAVEGGGYREYRSDLILDVRQMGLALRKLRAFSREGLERELDVEETIRATAQNAGELELVTRPPRRPNTRVVLLMDVGGSIDPHALVASRLFTAASKASHFKELRRYYFHNCVYGRLYDSARLDRGISVADLLQTSSRQTKLVVVGDAMMAPYELYVRGGALRWDDPDGEEGLTWLQRLAEHFQKSVWLNPEPVASWRHPTVTAIRQVFPMFPLTLDGLGGAVDHLTRGATTKR